MQKRSFDGREAERMGAGSAGGTGVAAPFFDGISTPPPPLSHAALKFNKFTKKLVFLGVFAAVLTAAALFSCRSPSSGDDDSQIEPPPGERTYDEFGGASADRIFTISVTEDWTAAIASISTGVGESNYFIDVVNDVAIAGSASSTFGSRSDIAVIIRGEDTTLSLNAAGNLIKTDAGQTVSIRDSLTLEGIATNTTSVVSVPSGSFEMSGTSKITGNTAGGTAGGGVRVQGGTLIMGGNASITSNKSTGNAGGTGAVGAGGVLLNGGTVEMSGNARIADNEAIGGGADAGGVGVMNGVFTMRGEAAISGNYCTDDGGGVAVSDGGTFVMKEQSKVHGNYALNSGGGPNGGGVFTWAATSKFQMMDEASVYANTGAGASNGGGGGVCIIGGSFEMGGGIIYGYDAADEHDTEHAVNRNRTGDMCNIVRSGTGAALYKSNGTANRGIFDVDGVFTETAALTTSETVISVNPADGELIQ
jgi:hypothetical protein